MGDARTYRSDGVRGRRTFTADSGYSKKRYDCVYINFIGQVFCRDNKQTKDCGIGIEPHTKVGAVVDEFIADRNTGYFFQQEMCSAMCMYLWILFP